MILQKSYRTDTMTRDELEEFQQYKKDGEDILGFKSFTGHTTRYITKWEEKNHILLYVATEDDQILYKLDSGKEGKKDLKKILIDRLNKFNERSQLNHMHMALIDRLNDSEGETGSHYNAENEYEKLHDVKKINTLYARDVYAYINKNLSDVNENTKADPEEQEKEWSLERLLDKIRHLKGYQEEEELFEAVKEACKAYANKVEIRKCSDVFYGEGFPSYVVNLDKYGLKLYFYYKIDKDDNHDIIRAWFW